MFDLMETNFLQIVEESIAGQGTETTYYPVRKRMQYQFNSYLLSLDSQPCKQHCYSLALAVTLSLGNRKGKGKNQSWCGYPWM